ncbi:hypothetical protein [Corynebacterium lubricantis]|uniref:hypothetical protein n=1 Tax=Corynebacterium lubricantis TaxID=541095 RepID=UPI000370CBB5|nr:hypothetical protein [Corynebacterium lubricantis]
MKAWLTTKEVCQELCIKPNTFTQYMKRGLFDGIDYAINSRGHRSYLWRSIDLGEIARRLRENIRVNRDEIVADFLTFQPMDTDAWAIDRVADGNRITRETVVNALRDRGIPYDIPTREEVLNGTAA